MSVRAATTISVLLVAAWCGLVFAMSAMPADDSTALSTGVIWHIVGFIVPGYDQLPAAEQLRWQEALQFPVRKAAHFSEYALLGMLMLNMVRRLARTRGAPLRKQVLASWLLAAAYAVTDEIHQIFVPGRTCKLMDIGIDAAGAITGIAIMALVLLVVRKARSRCRKSA